MSASERLLEPLREAIGAGDAPAALALVDALDALHGREVRDLVRAVTMLLPREFKRKATTWRVPTRDRSSVDPATGATSYETTSARLCRWSGGGASGSFVVDAWGTGSTVHDAALCLARALSMLADGGFKVTDVCTTHTGCCEPPSGYVEGRRDA